DGAVQALLAVGMNLEHTALLSGPSEVARRLDASAATLHQVISDLRGHVYDLRPRLLRDRRLADALRLLVDEFERDSGIATTLDLDVLAAVQAEARSAEVLSLTAAALARVRRHPGASACE